VSEERYAGVPEQIRIVPNCPKPSDTVFLASDGAGQVRLDAWLERTS